MKRVKKCWGFVQQCADIDVRTEITYGDATSVFLVTCSCSITFIIRPIKSLLLLLFYFIQSFFHVIKQLWGDNTYPALQISMRTEHIFWHNFFMSSPNSNEWYLDSVWWRNKDFSFFKYARYLEHCLLITILPGTQITGI